MWLVGALMACSKGMDSGFVADRRYTGLIKRTCMAAFLADADTAHPKQVIDMVTMDPGLSSQLDNLDYCDTGKVAYLSWVIQLGATFYAIFLALYVWGSDNSVKNFTASVQFPLMLGVLNINRGTWAIAVIGCCLPGRGEKKVKWLMGTTVLALMTDWLFISRAFEMAWHINQQLPPRWLGILSWVLPGVESFIFFAGLIAGYKKISYMGPWVLPMILSQDVFRRVNTDFFVF
ncbi:hypothetical protein BDZ45DRAFT_697902 [Acephala macrosclerotiorum]|nr:hypothetical protein BDZ45DRAFT_697902 [Acephala macrosclerotiorum]